MEMTYFFKRKKAKRMQRYMISIPLSGKFGIFIYIEKPVVLC